MAKCCFPLSPFLYHQSIHCLLASRNFANSFSGLDAALSWTNGSKVEVQHCSSAVDGGAWQESMLQLHKLFYFQPCRKAALRLMANSFGSVEPLPRIAAKSIQGKAFAVAVELRIAHNCVSLSVGFSTAQSRFLGQQIYSHFFLLGKFKSRRLCCFWDIKKRKRRTKINHYE